MKRKIWIWIGAVIAVILLGLSLYGARIWIFPRLVLSRSMNSAFTQLETRFEKSPIHLIRDIYDPDGYYLADLQLETDAAGLGPVRYDMDLQTQLAPLRISGDGTVVTGGKALDLELYLDGNFAAVSSESLVGGNYYGIAYDSFSQDIRSREVLTALLGDERISRWEKQISGLDQILSRDIKMPEFSPGDIEAALYAVLILDPEVSGENIQLSGEEIRVHTVTFRATGQQIADAAQPHQEELTPEVAAWIHEIRDDPQFFMEAVFYLDQENLIQMDGKIESSSGSCDLRVFLGTFGKNDPLTLEIETREGEELNRLYLTLENRTDTQSYLEKSRLTLTRNGVQRIFGMDYTYDLSSGEMDIILTKDAKLASMRLNLAGEGEKLTVTSQNIAPFLNLFRKKALESPVICTLSLQPGQEISVPQYKNLDQWSLEDLWIMIKGLGGLLGINS